MTPSPPLVLSRLADLLRGADRGRALARGGLALGAVVAGRVAGRVAQRRALPTPEALALLPGTAAWDVPLHEGTVRLSVRRAALEDAAPEALPPVLLLPPLTPVSSAHEMVPLFEALAADGTRDVLALDWLGFGRSDRPNVRYQSGLYQRHLRRLLTHHVGDRPIDLVACGHAAEVAAAVAFAAPERVRRLVLVAPTGMAHGSLNAAVFGRMLLGLVSGTGAFDVAFRARLATREAVRRFYQDHVFLPGAPVPDALLDAAAPTVRARGAAYAPRRLAEGLLSMEEHALGAYRHLRVPTLVVLPSLTGALAPHYDALAGLVRANDALRVVQARGGWLPHAEAPETVLPPVAAFLGAEAPDAAG